MPDLILCELTLADENAFFEGLSHWPEENWDWYTFVYKKGMSYSDMLERLRKNKLGINLKEGFVPDSMLYAFVENKIVGRANIRHELNDFLKTRGGHIGYAVANPYRKKGYATEMLNQTLNYCKSLGIKKILVTCTDNNVGSWKVIEKNGGSLENKFLDKENELIRRYWIEL